MWPQTAAHTMHKGVRILAPKQKVLTWARKLSFSQVFSRIAVFLVSNFPNFGVFSGVISVH